MGFRFEHLEGAPLARTARRIVPRGPSHRATLAQAQAASLRPGALAASPGGVAPLPSFDHALLVAEAEPASHAGALGNVVRGALASLACVAAVSWPLAALLALGGFVLLLLAVHGMVAVGHACLHACQDSRLRRNE